MRAVIVYESMFGSTKKAAESIAEGLAGALVEGELGRARAWGERLSGVTASEASSRRRQAS